MELVIKKKYCKHLMKYRYYIEPRRFMDMLKWNLSKDYEIDARMIMEDGAYRYYKHKVRLLKEIKKLEEKLDGVEFGEFGEDFLDKDIGNGLTSTDYEIISYRIRRWTDPEVLRKSRVHKFFDSKEEAEQAIEEYQSGYIRKIIFNVPQQIEEKKGWF